MSALDDSATAARQRMDSGRGTFVDAMEYLGWALFAADERYQERDEPMPEAELEKCADVVRAFCRRRGETAAAEMGNPLFLLAAVERLARKELHMEPARTG